MITVLLVATVVVGSQFGIITSCSGSVLRLCHGVTTTLDRKCIGGGLLFGDSVKVVRGLLVVKTSFSIGKPPKTSQTFKPSPAWQPLLPPLSPSDAENYNDLQKYFGAAVIRRSGGIVFPTSAQVPCALFTIVGGHGPYKVTAGSLDLYDRSTLDQPALAEALVAARDAQGVTSVDVDAGGGIVTVPLMSHNDEASLLSELAVGSQIPDATSRHLARATAFGKWKQYDFAKYEVDQLPYAIGGPLRFGSGSGAVAVAPPF